MDRDGTDARKKRWAKEVAGRMEMPIQQIELFGYDALVEVDTRGPRLLVRLIAEPGQHPMIEVLGWKDECEKVMRAEGRRMARTWRAWAIFTPDGDLLAISQSGEWIREEGVALNEDDCGTWEEMSERVYTCERVTVTRDGGRDG